MVEHGDLAIWRDPVRVENALGAQPVDEHDELVGGEVDVQRIPQLRPAQADRLGQVAAQPGPEMIELGVLQFP